MFIFIFIFLWIVNLHWSTKETSKDAYKIMSSYISPQAKQAKKGKLEDITSTKIKSVIFSKKSLVKLSARILELLWFHLIFQLWESKLDRICKITCLVFHSFASSFEFTSLTTTIASIDHSTICHPFFPATSYVQSKARTSASWALSQESILGHYLYDMAIFISNNKCNFSFSSLTRCICVDFYPSQWRLIPCYVCFEW